MTYTGVSFAWCIFDNAHPPIEGVLPLKNSFPPVPLPIFDDFQNNATCKLKCSICMQ